MVRLLALVIFGTTLGISAYHRRRARIATGTIPRRAEARHLVAGRLIVALPLFGGIVAYLIDPAWMAWSEIVLPSWVPWLGVVVGFSNVLVVHWVLRALGPNVSETVLTKAQHDLVMHGPYRWVRHPLYTAGIVLFVSLGLIAANWFIVVMAGVALVGVRLVVIPREEHELIKTFGSSYHAYRARTGAMLPRIWT